MSTYGIKHFNSAVALGHNGHADDDWPTTSTTAASGLGQATASVAALPGVAAAAALDVHPTAVSRLSRLSSGSETNLESSGKDPKASASTDNGLHAPSELATLEALDAGDLERVLTLMARGWDLNARVAGGTTYALHVAVRSVSGFDLQNGSVKWEHPTSLMGAPSRVDGSIPRRGWEHPTNLMGAPSRWDGSTRWSEWEHPVGGGDWEHSTGWMGATLGGRVITIRPDGWEPSVGGWERPVILMEAHSSVDGSAQ